MIRNVSLSPNKPPLGGDLDPCATKWDNIPASFVQKSKPNHHPTISQVSLKVPSTSINNASIISSKSSLILSRNKSNEK